MLVTVTDVLPEVTVAAITAGSTGTTSSGSPEGETMVAVPVPVALAGSEMVMLACPMATDSVVTETKVMGTAQGMVNVPV
jgi:hypothetical protein